MLSRSSREAALAAGLKRHYARVLEEPLPFLRGRTPIEAARSAENRQRVADWLKSLENTAAHRAGGAMGETDFTWMWELLGLTDLRR